MRGSGRLLDALDLAVEQRPLQEPLAAVGNDELPDSDGLREGHLPQPAERLAGSLQDAAWTDEKSLAAGLRDSHQVAKAGIGGPQDRADPRIGAGHLAPHAASLKHVLSAGCAGRRALIDHRRRQVEHEVAGGDARLGPGIQDSLAAEEALHSLAKHVRGAQPWIDQARGIGVFGDLRSQPDDLGLELAALLAKLIELTFELRGTACAAAEVADQPERPLDGIARRCGSEQAGAQSGVDGLPHLDTARWGRNARPAAPASSRARQTKGEGAALQRAGGRS